MIRNIKLSITVLTISVCTASTILPNNMVTNTKAALDRIRSAVVHEAKENKKLIAWPAIVINTVLAVGYDAQTRSMASIARPFFLVKKADQCLSSIDADDDIAYLQSVFTEFYSSGEQSTYRLITILHRHMMTALGLPITKSLEQFKHMMEKTNSHHYPTALNNNQFKIYCRCVARGLYAVYWVKHGLS